MIDKRDVQAFFDRLAPDWDAGMVRNEVVIARILDNAGVCEGCTVLDDATGEELGKLKRVLHYPAHKVYEVKGAREYLIPAVPGVFIASVDIDAGVVRIHNMKGLATDEN